MDLGLKGRRALVCASSRGLGRACARALAREGAAVVINGRDPAALEQTAQALRAETGGEITAVVADLDVEAERERLVAACPDADILVNNNGGPPPGRFQDWDHAAWLAALEANLLAPVLLIRALLPGMRERGFGRIVNITSAMVKAPAAPLGLSTAARSGLTAVCKALSREVAADNVTINNLLPERFDTDRQLQMATLVSKVKGISMEEARAEQVRSIAAGRLGTPEEFGEACAFLCSAQAGYISGQNLQLDGGSYPGVV
ncbi:MAG: SDR family oxidoreductase [Myxococcales bacterium]|nr:SDR family oxidoreductase [Myxococcales bacterium]